MYCWVVSSLCKSIHKGLAVLMAVALLTVSVLPSFAADTEYLSKDSFWNWIAGKGGIVQKVTGYLPGTGTCTQSDDGYHHSTSAYRVSSDGSHFLCVCDYCGKDFSAYESDLQQSYDTQVEDIRQDYGTVEFGSNGFILPVPVTGIGGSFQQGEILESTVGYSFSCTFLADPKYLSSTYYEWCISVLPDVTLIAPVTGTYTLTLEGSFNHCEIHHSTPLPFVCHFAAGSVMEGSSYHKMPGNNARCCAFAVRNYSGVRDVLSSFSGRLYFFVEPVTYDVDDYTVSIGGINSRPTSITGDYGIIGDNGQIIKVEGDKIVNETNNTYYNPSTGETTTIIDWFYNYEDRSYTVTTEAGDTVTITYGDENVVIKEGDTIYNVYYLVNGSGSENPDPGPGTCNHQWAETSTTPATCTVPGSRLLTCSLCNETKTETIPAPGHKWTIKQEVKNEYDSSGNQTQEGYTIWECSVCGEQQKTTDGTAPPGGGSGTGSGSSGGVFSGIFGLLVDFLGFFFNTFRDFVGEGVKGFLNALMDGTSPIFGLLNPFNWGG